MGEVRNLTKGSITKGISSLAIPLITASFVQMAYNLTDMIWLGHLGSTSIAAVGVAGFFLWLCNALSFTTKVGAEVTISQSLGAGAYRRAFLYANQSTMVSFVFAFLYASFIFVAAPGLVSFFRLEPDISAMSVDYMRIVTPGIFFTFNNNTFSGVFNGQGNSRTPLKIVAVGLVMNMILDPLLIYGWGAVPAMGTRGAAIATAFSQFVVFAIFVWNLYLKRRRSASAIAFGNIPMKFVMKPSYVLIKRIVLLGLPVSMQSALFSMFSMTLGSMASNWGHIGVAVQSVGSQIEAITWMTAAGFSTALASFVGQNYGARDFARIRKGYAFTLKLAIGISLTATFAFLFFGGELFSIFVNDPVTIAAGRDYMMILAVSQVFSALESVTAGAFNGSGRTVPPAITGILLNGARLPMAWLLMHTSLELNGIWWSVSISSILKGVLLSLWYLSFRKRLENGHDMSVRKGIYKPIRDFGKRVYVSIASRLWQQ